MISPADVLQCYQAGANALEKLASDIPDERWAEQPVAGMNHPAWLFGHLDIYHRVIVALLKGEPFANPWTEPCGKESSPESERSAYPAKDAILARHTEAVAAASAAISGAPAEAWTAPLEHPTWGKQFATVSPAVVYLATTHLATHLGQLSGWRRAAGMPRV